MGFRGTELKLVNRTKGGGDIPLSFAEHDLGIEGEHVASRDVKIPAGSSQGITVLSFRTKIVPSWPLAAVASSTRAALSRGESTATKSSEKEFEMVEAGFPGLMVQ